VHAEKDLDDNATHEECVVIGCAASSTATNEITLQASVANIIKATPTTITHQGNSIAGDIKSDGTVSMSANLDMNTNNIINVVDPTLAQDAATKNYVDTNTANDNYLLKSGGTMAGSIDYAGFDMTNVKRIINSTLAPNNRRVIIGNGNVNAGLYGISIGEDAGEGTTDSSIISIGKSAGKNKGVGTVCIGSEAGFNGSARTRMVCIGASAGRFGDNDDTVIIGQSAHGDNATHEECVVIGCAASSTATNEITLQASVANIIKATPTTITHQGVSIAGDIKSDGTVSMSANLDAGTNKVIGVVDPTAAQDAATKNYVDTATVNTNYLLKTGGTMIGKIGDLQTPDTKIRLGNLSGITNQGTNTVAIGTNAGNINQGQDSVAIGNTCGQTSQGSFSVAVGLATANANQGQQCVALGYNSQNSGSNNNSTALGARSGETNQHSKSICINANTSALNSTAEDQIKIKAGVSEFTYDADGFVIANALDTIGVAEGSLRTLGGITSTKNMYCGANMYIVGDVPTVLSSTNATDSSSVSTGAIHTDGGLGVAKDVHIGGSMYLQKSLCEVYVHNNITATPIADANWTVITADNLTTNSNTLNFTATNTLNKPRITYNGTRTTLFHAGCTFSVNPASSADIEWEVGLSKNGVDITSSHVLMHTVTNGYHYSSAVHAFVELATNDYVEIIVKNLTNTVNIIFDNVNVFLVGMPNTV
jgi:uncharacterized protein (DUF302 family)